MPEEDIAASPPSYEMATSPAPSVGAIEGLDSTTAIQDQDGTIRIEGLDLSALSKNTVITVEKLESGEETYILHTEQLEGLTNEQTIAEMVTGHVVEVTDFNTKVTSASPTASIQKLSDVKITPVRAYVASDSQASSTMSRETSTSTQTEDSDSDEEEPIEVNHPQGHLFFIKTCVLLCYR